MNLSRWYLYAFWVLQLVEPRTNVICVGGLPEVVFLADCHRWRWGEQIACRTATLYYASWHPKLCFMPYLQQRASNDVIACETEGSCTRRCKHCRHSNRVKAYVVLDTHAGNQTNLRILIFSKYYVTPCPILTLKLSPKSCSLP